MRCWIFCSSLDGEYGFLSESQFAENIADSFVICADGGYRAAEKLGIKPDLWVGDMDSYNGEIEECCEKKLFPSDKDMSDSHIAVLEALERNMTEIYLTGATGGRLDHEYSNYCLLKLVLKKGGFASIINKNNRVFMTDKPMDIRCMGEKYISFFPFGGEIKNFTVKNAKYELTDYCLGDDTTYTVSNEFLDGQPVRVDFSTGYLLVICSNDLT